MPWRPGVEEKKMGEEKYVENIMELHMYVINNLCVMPMNSVLSSSAWI